jgi:hypothetical protein
MKADRIPNVFVFTKMQTDAGEDIGAIRNRKELERLAGGGEFWWGIGESKGKAVRKLLAAESRPKVLFSVMSSRPNMQSRDPGEVLLWQAWRTPQGECPLPPHVIITSGATTRSGEPKRRYHALICESNSSILQNGGGAVDSAKLINMGDSGRPIGSSQVTAVVRYHPDVACSVRLNEIAARAELASPFFADLAKPRKLSEAERRDLDEVGREGKSVEDWLSLTRRLRQSHAWDL